MAENRPTAELEKRIVWNEKLAADPVDVPGGGMEAAKKFSIQGSFLRIANAAIGIGVTICMTMRYVPAGLAPFFSLVALPVSCNGRRQAENISLR